MPGLKAPKPKASKKSAAKKNSTAPPAGYRAKYKMPLMIAPEVVLYSVRPRVVLAWTEKDFPDSATRWEFLNVKR